MKILCIILLFTTLSEASIKKVWSCFPFEKNIKKCEGASWKRDGATWVNGDAYLDVRRIESGESLNQLMKLIKVKLTFENKNVVDQVTFNPNIKLIRVNSMSNNWFLALIKKGDETFQVQCHGRNGQGFQQSCETLFE